MGALPRYMAGRGQAMLGRAMVVLAEQHSCPSLATHLPDSSSFVMHEAQPWS